MDITSVLNIILPIVFIIVGIALIVFVVELIKTLKVTQGTISNLEPTLKNVEDITTNIQPTLAKIDPLMDRVQLTVDSVNLEMMRVDQILEDVSEITDTASSATAAVDNITNAPIKAVNSVASRVKSAFGGKDASEESAQLAEQRVAVAQALEEYKAAEEKDAKKFAKSEDAEVATEGDTVSEMKFKPVLDPVEPAGSSKGYVQVDEDAKGASKQAADSDVSVGNPFLSDDSDAK